MEVNYTGFPTPEVHWYREGVEIQPSRDFQITHLYQKSSLIVPEVFLEDAGTFTVRAISPAGMAECRALLVVDGQLSTSLLLLLSVHMRPSVYEVALRIAPRLYVCLSVCLSRE